MAADKRPSRGRVPERPGAPTPDRLRELAAWYREFAERAGSPAIEDARLRTAEQLEAEADRLETRTRRNPA